MKSCSSAILRLSSQSKFSLHSSALMAQQKKHVLVPVADGTEDMEAISIIDILDRAGAEVTVASVMEGRNKITTAHKVRIDADKNIAECVDETWDLVALPGGMPGATNLKASASLAKILEKQRQAGRWYGAICASPAVVLQAQGLLKDRQATCFPAFHDKLADQSLTKERTVISGNCVTSQSAGSAAEFGLTLVQVLYSPEKAEEVATKMMLPKPAPFVAKNKL